MGDRVIMGDFVVLRPAGIEDRRLIYEWLVSSDVSRAMMGPPTFAERAFPTWEEFQEDYPAYFFDDSSPELGRCLLILADGEPVGQVSYNDIWEREGWKRTELDIWMRSEACCGRGYGTDALFALCRMLSIRFGVQEFMMQPSARNPRAIRAYGRVGFRSLDIPLAAAIEQWGPSDYFDSVYMVKFAPTATEGQRDAGDAMVSPGGSDG